MTVEANSAFGDVPPSSDRRAAGPSPGIAEATSTGDFVRMGVEEEFHVVDLESRELVAQAAQVLRSLPSGPYTDELQRSVVESNSPVCETLAGLRDALVETRRLLVDVARGEELGIVAAGSVPLVDPLRLAVTPSTRYERMLADYQLLVREQLICGAQVHVQVSDRDLAVAVAQRVAPYLPVLLALSASSPFWMGEDTGYASVRSLLWQRWPTAGLSGEISSAAEHDALVADLVASETISDPGMIYFDVRPSAHLPTLELRVPDACPSVDDVVLLAGLFRALVRREKDAALGGTPVRRRPAPLLRSGLWRAARSGLEGSLLDLPDSPRPVPAAAAVTQLVEGLRGQLEASGDWHVVSTLAERALARGSSAAQQRAAYQRRGRLADVVDLLVEVTDPASAPASLPGTAGPATRALPLYRLAGDEVLPPGGPTAGYAALVSIVEQLGASALRGRERVRDEEQRSRGVTFGVNGRASGRLFPVDLIPRIVLGQEWAGLRRGLVQRAAALDAFLRDVYAQRQVVADGILPAWVVDAAPGLRSVGAILDRQPVRAHVCGMDIVRDAAGAWFLLEDNVRVPSGLGYAVQNRRLCQAVMPDLPRPAGLLDVEAVPALLRATLEEAALPAAPDTPSVVLLSEGPEGSAWFEHRMLGEEMGVPVAVSTELLVDDASVYLLREGRRRQVDVLYLRIDEEALLHATGADGRPLGPSLRAAVDAGRVALANAPGNGVGDDKAVYAFVPRLIEYYLGERPLLDSVPTYLCAVPDQREAVLDRLDRVVLKPVDGYGGEGVVIGPLASGEELAATRRQLLAAPHRWIAQEMIELSTHPSFDGEQLAPRHVDLRAFVFSGNHVAVAPAALTRVAPAGSMVVNSSRGGGSKDTWLLAEASPG